MAKKLKKIPDDLMPYIQNETVAIKDSRDKTIISSYCLNKLKNVEWYIRLLESGNEQYAVPHNAFELESIRAQLSDCYERIMSASIQKAGRPLIDIKYPEGYEG